MRISDWSSDVCSSDLIDPSSPFPRRATMPRDRHDSVNRRATISAEALPRRRPGSSIGPVVTGPRPSAGRGESPTFSACRSRRPDGRIARMDFDAIVIGGGHNGLVCAWYLARGGKRVLVLERREIVGGAAVTEEFRSEEHPSELQSLMRISYA